MAKCSTKTLGIIKEFVLEEKKHMNVKNVSKYLEVALTEQTQGNSY